jgi:type II secretory pathway pseudopilin PulG
MLLVVAVFALLAAMFMLSSQFALTKSKVSRVIQDQRQVTRMLDQYMTDYMRLPSEQDGLASLIQGSHGTSYLSTLPVDPFAQGDPSKSPYFLYYTNFSNQIQCLVVSIGPDRVDDVGPAIAAMRDQRVSLSGIGSSTPKVLFKNASDAQNFIAWHSYDPTNGTASRGDIIQPYSGGMTVN